MKMLRCCVALVVWTTMMERKVYPYNIFPVHKKPKKWKWSHQTMKCMNDKSTWVPVERFTLERGVINYKSVKLFLSIKYSKQMEIYLCPTIPISVYAFCGLIPLLPIFGFLLTIWERVERLLFFHCGLNNQWLYSSSIFMLRNLNSWLHTHWANYKDCQSKFWQVEDFNFSCITSSFTS